MNQLDGFCEIMLSMWGITVLFWETISAMLLYRDVYYSNVF